MVKVYRHHYDEEKDMEEERFKCPNCGHEMTAIALELQRLKDNHDKLFKTMEEILRTVFDSDELMRMNDRRESDVS